MAKCEKSALRAAENLQLATRALKQELARSREAAQLNENKLNEKIVQLEEELREATKGTEGEDDDDDDDDYGALSSKPTVTRRKKNQKKKQELAKQKQTLMKTRLSIDSEPPAAEPTKPPPAYSRLRGDSDWERFRIVAKEGYEGHMKDQNALEKETKKCKRTMSSLRAEKTRARGSNGQIDSLCEMNDVLRTQLEAEADDEIAIANGEYSDAVGKVETLEKRAILRGLVLSMLMDQARNQVEEARQQAQVFIIAPE